MRNTLILLAPMLLSACIDSTANYPIDGKERALVMHAVQDRFWVNEVSLQLIATNLPDCQRRFELGKVPADRLNVELSGNLDGIFTLESGSRTWRVATNSCGELAPAAPGTGKLLGAFRLIADQLVFVEAGSTTLASAR
jgi:hypothetical protein